MRQAKTDSEEQLAKGIKGTSMFIFIISKARKLPQRIKGKKMIKVQQICPRDLRPQQKR